MESVIMVFCNIAVGICIGLVLGERHSRRAVQDEMRIERDLIKDAMKGIAESHNQLSVVQKTQQDALYDLEQKISFLVQGAKR